MLTGKNGQIGYELHRLLPKLGRLVAPDRHELDLHDADSIRRAVRDQRPQVIVNAAAYTAVDAAESDEARAHRTNAEAVGVLAREAEKIGALLLHYSTDYVFDGAKRVAYDEGDWCRPLNAYGRTKLAGEMAIRESGVSHLILRTSWVYATRGKNFLLTILRLATEREELKIVRDQVGAPTCASDIAAGTVSILASALGREHGETSGASRRPADSVAARRGDGDEDGAAPRGESEDTAAARRYSSPPRCGGESDIPSRGHRAGSISFGSGSCAGTFHMTAAGETNWFEFARAILEEARNAPRTLPWLAAATQGRPLIAKRIIPISTEEFRSPTQRPAYSVLSNARLAKVFHTALPDWRTQLHRCFAEPEDMTATL